MSNFDTLEAYEKLLEAGIPDKEAKAQTHLLAKAAKPEIDLQMAFEKMNNRFDLMDERVNKRFDLVNLEMKYIEKIGSYICVAIVVNILSVWLNG